MNFEAEEPRRQLAALQPLLILVLSGSKRQPSQLFGPEHAFQMLAVTAVIVAVAPPTIVSVEQPVSLCSKNISSFLTLLSASDPPNLVYVW